MVKLDVFLTPKSLGIQKQAELLGLCSSKQAKVGKYNCPQTISLYKNLSRKVITLNQGRAHGRKYAQKMPNCEGGGCIGPIDVTWDWPESRL